VRQTIILVTILIVGVSLAVGLLVGNLAGGSSDSEPPFATLPPATPTIVGPPGTPVGTAVASPSPVAARVGFALPRQALWTKRRLR
jgi:hypothetical protein